MELKNDKCGNCEAVFCMPGVSSYSTAITEKMTYRYTICPRCMTVNYYPVESYWHTSEVNGEGNG